MILGYKKTPVFSVSVPCVVHAWVSFDMCKKKKKTIPSEETAESDRKNGPNQWRKTYPRVRTECHKFKQRFKPFG